MILNLNLCQAIQCYCSCTASSAPLSSYQWLWRLVVFFLIYLITFGSRLSHAALRTILCHPERCPCTTRVWMLEEAKEVWLMVLGQIKSPPSLRWAAGSCWLDPGAEGQPECRCPHGGPAAGAGPQTISLHVMVLQKTTKMHWSLQGCVGLCFYTLPRGLLSLFLFFNLPWISFISSSP